MNTNDNQQLVELISAIKHISLNRDDLLDVSLEMALRYFKKDKESEEQFDKFWANPQFIDQTVLCAREGIVLAMQAITLDEKIPFEPIIQNCIEIEQQRYTEKEITINVKEISHIKEFCAFLRKELFSRIYSQNKELQKTSKIPKDVLQSRYNYFMNQSF